MSHAQILERSFLSSVTFKSGKINNSRYRSLIQEGCVCTRRGSAISAGRECGMAKTAVPGPGKFSFFSPAAAPGGAVREEPGLAREGEPLPPRQGSQLLLPLTSSPWPRFLSNLVSVDIDIDFFNFSAHLVLLSVH